ncbi:hypothetical protein J7T55_007183 [Diaporthe amygdali]|uniref:uncharacterized protein n=1 Tax=Phomopsis amygdali TaxID=1214568 RepID=UPI0022FEE1A2|nr:uncharacterized protein J7T55_007183 [Diaporthe amygdali]KAJ0108064.1 hypothetical protein J7T55_007183 [Diaporthe amygdali]
MTSRRQVNLGPFRNNHLEEDKPSPRRKPLVLGRLLSRPCWIQNPARLGDRGPSQVVGRKKDAQHIKALSYNRHITSRAPCIAAITRRQGPNQGQEVSTQPIINGMPPAI